MSARRVPTVDVNDVDDDEVEASYTCYIGPLSRRDNPAYRFRVKFNKSEPSSFFSHYIAHFVDNAEFSDFKKDYSNLKKFLADLNNDLNSGEMNTSTWDRIAREAWLPMVERFIQKWTAEFLPPDIRQDVTSLEEYFGRVPRIWPDVLELPDD